MVRVIYEKSLKRKVRDFIKSKGLVNLILTLVLLLVIPITVFVALKPQDIRQRASSPSIIYTGNTPNLVLNDKSDIYENYPVADTVIKKDNPISWLFIPIIIVICAISAAALVISLLNKHDYYT